MNERSGMDSDLLTLEELATYLKVSPKTIHRMLQVNEIPGLKVGGQWRFLRDSVLAWLSERAINAQPEDLVNVITTADTIVPVTRLVGPERIVLNLPSDGDKADILGPMVEALASTQSDLDPQRYLRSLLKREAMVTTAIAKGVAFPHVRNPAQFPTLRPCIVLGICPNGANFDSLDNEPTYIFAMCCSPTEVVHLRLLSNASLLLRDPEVVGALRGARSKQDVMAMLVKADCRLSVSF